MRRPRRLRLVAAWLAGALPLALAPAALADRAEVDYAFVPVPPAAGPPARPLPKFTFIFGEPAKWSGTYRWRYNPALAPPPFAGDVTGTVAVLRRTFDAWTAVCGVTHAYEGETATPPDNRTVASGGSEQPDYENVVGWAALDGTTAGLTYAWYRPAAAGSELVDADVLLSTTQVTGGAAMERVAKHEWGHALGLGHSDQPGMLMSGPPLSAYNNLAILRYDDVRACRCLYGPAPGQPAGYACAVPADVDLGLVPIGAPSSPRSLVLRNDGNAPLRIDARTVDSAEIAASGGCAPGAEVPPGGSCAISLVAQAGGGGANSTLLALQTSDGPYVVTLRYEGTGAPGPATVELVEYAHAGFGHYFVTALPAEIAKLDDGTFAGWRRTGRAMRAWPEPHADTVPVCRFFSARFAPKSSHFYTASAAECATVKANADWQFEGEVFHVALPDARGACPARTLAVYRLYNDGASGAPNHRFTTDVAVRDAMLAQGWRAEGAGAGVALCVPP
ncbi:MAG: hypothetical protein BroJett026_05800 [Betaproteobacteria bacterium]|nr:MAG: hypothetical protein BroJett026_05800 [Betaproteobacteria bacterium]